MVKRISSLRNRFFSFLILIVLLSACQSYKDLTMMRDLQGQSNLLSRSVIDYRYKIRVNDNLYVSIVSTNPELDEIYNPATIGFGRGGINMAGVWSDLPSQLVLGYMVDLDGSIILPTLGKINVMGLTIPECEAEIQAKANQYLKNVTAKVRLLNFKVTVMGEVENPGVFFNYNSEFTVFDAIGMANGVRNTAALNNVLVIREVGTRAQTFRLDLTDSKSLTSDGYNILPNDVVVVQPAKYKDLELKLPLYTMILSSITTFLLVLNYIEGL